MIARRLQHLLFEGEPLRQTAQIQPAAVNGIHPAINEPFSAMLLLLNDQVSMTQEDLVKECSALFGFARTADNIQTQMAKAIEYAVQSGKMRVENDRLFANA